MKKYYMMPQTEAITFAPEEHVLDSLIIPGSGDGPSVGAPIRSSGPLHKAGVMYI